MITIIDRENYHASADLLDRIYCFRHRLFVETMRWEACRKPDGRERATRDVYFPEGGFAPATIVRREALAPGDEIAGPAIVEFMDSTVVVPPAWALQVRDDGILEVRR